LADKAADVELAIARDQYAQHALDERLIQALHRDFAAELVPSIGGRWRQVDVQVGSHQPPPHHRVAELMRAYALDLQARLAGVGPDDDDRLFETLAFVEGQLLSIHPFADFNGRVTRIFLSEVLRRLDLPAVDPTPEAGPATRRYLAALAAADGRNWQPLKAIWRERFEADAFVERHFLTLTGYSPMSWQKRLFREYLLAGELPKSVDLPTGMGKTAVMALWLIALAWQMGQQAAPSLPRRLIYVVDRRAVVDQATDFAAQLRRNLAQPEAGELRAALGLTARALPISTLRGQFVDNRAWLEDPACPAIVVGTVDMIGSRVLFSGYGVSRKMRPYQAGLLGADTLLVLDEAHLVPPFERLLERIASGLDANGRTLNAVPAAVTSTVPTMRLLSLSATGRQRTADETFVLTPADREQPLVHQRLQAPKRIQLCEAIDPKELPDMLAEHAWQLCEKSQRAGRVLIFVNSRDHAQKVQQSLRKRTGKAGQAEVELFVGARRVHERQQASERLAKLGFLAGSAQAVDSPAFLVATSAGEVGVDLDADHAVCDLVAWERMVQRLGRVNRRGTGDAAIIVVPSRLEDEAAQARQLAVRAVLQMLPLNSDGTLDGSPAALAGLRALPQAREALEKATTPPPLYPPLTRALVDAWAMTSLDRHTGRPEVAPWLRGWPEEPELPQVSVVWRRHLPVDDQGHLFTGQQMELFLDSAGPHLAERLESDLPGVLDWLLKRAKSLPEKASFVGQDGAARHLLQGAIVAAFIPDADGNGIALTGAAIAAASRRTLEAWARGTTLWVDCRLGGLTDGLLDEAADAPALDVTEVGTPAHPGPVPLKVMRVDRPDLPAPEEGWRTEASFALKQSDDGVLAWLLVSSQLSQQAGSEEGRSGAQRAQLLVEHQAWAEIAARSLARALHLPQAYAEMLAAAAHVHDEGKQAARWQQAFHAPHQGRPPYAKTLGRPNVALLDGYRHEFGSLPHAEANLRVQALSPDLRELCLHLVAAHHGAARPLIRTDAAPEPPSRAKARACEIASRYCALSERWGPWGLAWWEALLRAADQQASRRNDEEGRKHG
jgi:CRISPR-associated endonuclease/helicase Cas3